MRDDAFAGRIPPDLQEVVDFHGHLCPGVVIGYRAVLIGLSRLEGHRSEDEELVCVVENDSCSVDAIQHMAGCTFGNVTDAWGTIDRAAHHPTLEGWVDQRIHCER